MNDKTAIDALLTYEFSAFEDDNKQEYFLRTDVLAALAPTVQDVEPAQGMPDAVAILRSALKGLINIDQRCGWHSKEQDAAVAALAATERAATQATPANSHQSPPDSYQPGKDSHQAAPTIDYPGRIEGMTDDTPHFQRLIDGAAPTVQGSVELLPLPEPDARATWNIPGVGVETVVGYTERQMHDYARAALAQRATVAEVAHDTVTITAKALDAINLALESKLTSTASTPPTPPRSLYEVQRDAAEAAVCAELEAKGLLSTPPAPAEKVSIWDVGAPVMPPAHPVATDDDRYRQSNGGE